MADGETVHEAHLSPQVLQPTRVPTPTTTQAAGVHVDHPQVFHAAAAGRNGSSSSANGNGNGHRANGYFNGNGKPVADLESHLEEYEKGILLKALEDAGGVKKRAAEILGINYRSFRHRLSKYGLNGDVQVEVEA